ncbi:DNA-binding IclR family transcriptional regulator [Geomicrobium halophilum]|uniref:Glycerol operon regulatory protein n=1 Tax=Geomicrobium halophilum TaxID=549000 RepID=A0A841Q2F1_9BACL|nr:IclR family transcriptional regulator [Geomicrobium halophilum]MBB6450518.1 DNA-binding IclR family transcriptional regulator [Geomicrobium halophilum]
MEKNEPPKGIRTLQRAIDILNCFHVDEAELTLTEIANKIDLAKSTTTRLLATLEHNHFVEKNPVTMKYRLGRQLYFIGHVAGQSIELRSVSESTMKRLRNQTKETVNLYVLDGEQRVCIQQYESTQSIKHMVSIGQKLPITVGASGKVLLAHQSQKFIEEAMVQQPMKKNKVDLKNELNMIVEEKYTVSIEERETGTSAVSSPIFDINGNILAALSVSGPSSRFKPQERPELKTTLLAAAMEISNNLGYPFNHTAE